MSAAVTWLIVVPIWLALSVVVGIAVGKFIRFGEGKDERLD